jgi:exoribonuclease R
MVVACTRLLRGSGYAGFDGQVPDQPEHAALAAEYAHVTAPLRRLGDRYASEICVALCAGVPVPDWVLGRLDEVPRTMEKADQLAHRYEGAVIDLVEAGVLQHRVGEQFDAVVVEVDDQDDKQGTITLQEPAVEARATSAATVPLGNEVTATLTEADLGARSVLFTV